MSLNEAQCGRVSLRIAAERSFPHDHTYQVEGDIFVMSSPLCRGYVLLESEGVRLHDGPVRPGMLRVVSPGERVRVRVQSPSHGLFLTFPGNTLREALLLEGHKPGQSSFIEPLLQPNDAVAALCRSLVSAQSTLKASQLMTDSVAHALLACVLHAKRRNARVGSRKSAGFCAAEIRSCREYAEAHLQRGVDLIEWAKQLDMTTVEFTRRFQESLKNSPYSWFLQLRISRSKVLLKETKQSLSAIALATGFCNQSHFTLVFRKIVGCSPGRWRAIKSETPTDIQM